MEAHQTLRRITDALDFAARAHDSKTDNGSAAEPHINHGADVAARLARSLRADPNTVVAAILHDLLEDTRHSIEEIGGRFGSNVGNYVCVMTGDKSLPKQERKRLQIIKAAEASKGAKRIKLAGKASNLAALVKSPPHWWDGGAAGTTSPGRGRWRPGFAGFIPC